jgi:cellulose synthase/poly-beta-1,6-N-acetylglucosamine synthase-like glycosyltransferase
MLLPWRVRSLCNDWYRSVVTLGVQAQTRLADSRNGREAPDRTAQRPLVSILIPTLAKGSHAGRLATLKELLGRHLPAQSHQDYEAIVYCDGRNDDVERMIAELDDSRIRVYWTADTDHSAWGHPQTRCGIDVARGDYFVRVNDDNRPYPEYLHTLLRGFSEDTGISYARVVFKGEARKAYSYLLRGSYVIPRDRFGALENGNIDCLCYMVRMDLARRYREHWGDIYAADWRFLEAMLADGVKANYVNRLIADKC